MERPPGRPQEAPGDPQEASKRLQSCPQEASTHRKPNQARRNARSDEIININIIRLTKKSIGGKTGCSINNINNNDNNNNRNNNNNNNNNINISNPPTLGRVC